MNKLPVRVRAMTYALEAACHLADPEVAAYALTHGADPNGDGEVPTPLNILCNPTRWAKRSDVFQVAKLLLSAGADVNVVSPSHVTPVYYAAWTENYDFVRVLIAAGADVNLCDPCVQIEKIIVRPLIMGWLDVASILVDAGCELEDIDRHGTGAREAAEIYLCGDTLTDALAMIDTALASRNQSQPGGSNGR